MNNVNEKSSETLDIPENIIIKWQRIVDLMAKTVGVPAGLIMKVYPSQIEVFISSQTEGNPYKKGERENLGTGLYCETVMKQRGALLVPDALKDHKWDKNPDIELGMIYYFGFPILLPNGELFGTICALDKKNNPEASKYNELLSEFRGIIENDLQIISETTKRKRVEALLRELGDHLPEGAVYRLVHEDNGHRYFDYVSSGFERLFGIKATELMKDACLLYDLTYPGDIERIVATEARSIETLKAFNYEGRLIFPSGEIRWYKWHSQPNRLNNGSIHWDGVCLDITRRKKAEESLEKAHDELEQRVIERTSELRKAYDDLASEIENHKRVAEALRESEARFKGIFENTKNGVAVYQAVNDGKDFIFIDFNKGAEKIERIKKEYLIGKSVLEMFPGVKEFGLFDVLQRVWRTGNSEYHPISLYEDQRIRGWRDSYICKLLSGEIIAVYSDETKNKQAEEDLKKSRNMLQAIFDGISDPLILRQKDATIRMMNKAAAEYYQISLKQTVSGKSCFTLFKEKSESCKACPISQSISNYASFERKGCMNPSRIEQVTVYPIKDSGNKPGTNILHIRDITVEKQMEQELIQADKMISLGILVSGVAHEINNPNNFIMLNAPLLKEVWESVIPVLENHYRKHGDFVTAGLPYSEMRKEVPNLLKGIEVGSRRIQQIVKDLNEYSRNSNEKMDDSACINDIVRQAVTLIYSQIKKSTQKFFVEYGQNLPPIEGHSQKLEQVMINLIQNACQSLPDTEKSIHVSTGYDEKDEHIVVSVQDEGTGILNEIRTRIMDPFFTTRRDFGGTGLGLAVSSKIIKEHNGKIKVYSDPGKGSTFIVYLPVKQKK